MTEAPEDLMQLRYQVGQTYIPKAGPHRYHTLHVVNAVILDRERDRVTIACESCTGYFRFIDHWGRWL